MTRSARWLRFISALKIRARNRKIIPLDFNYPQRRVWGVVADKIDHLEPIRLIILKARREGISTEVESWLMTMIAAGDNVNALVTAHQRKPAGKIWSMSKLFVTSSPILSKLATVGANKIEIGRSILEVATAGSPESERGGDLTAWHASEAAFYPHPEVMTATMQSLPDSQDIFTIGVLESTANGKVGDGALFYQEWTRAVEGDSDWVPIFLPYHEFPEYSLPGIAVEQLDAEEFELRKRFELTDAQLAWRRWKIANDLQGDIDKFHQEYPAFPEEAFIQSGLPFFRPEHLLPLEADIRKGTRGDIDAAGTFHATPKGPVEIFVWPQDGHEYVVGGDSSMGIEDPNETGPGGHSRSAAEVIDMETMEQVAEYDGVSPPHLFARHLSGLGRLYKNALLAPEVQSSGGGGGRELIVYLRDLEYWNLHVWKQPDRVERTRGTLYGWECLAPDALVLTADLRYVPARQVKEGDWLVGCRETVTGGKGSAIPVRLQAVTQRRVFVAPMLAVTLEDGRETRVSANHPFLTYRTSRKDLGWRWRLASETRPGDRVKALPLWEPDRSYEAGRLSAFLDGEGHLSRSTRRGGFQMLVTQVEGALADEIRELWSTLGYHAAFRWLRHKARAQEQTIATSGLLRLVDVLRALGSLRPTRLLRKFEALADDGVLTLRAFPSLAVTKVDDIGDGPVVGLTTSPDHTLIADGIVGHNTNARTRPRMLARIREVVMERSAVIHSRRLLTQLASFGEADSGRMESLAGHDDLLFAWGIALVSRTENYFAMPPQATTAAMPDWQSLGLRVLHPESAPDRLRRLMATPDRSNRGFLEL